MKQWTLACVAVAFTLVDIAEAIGAGPRQQLQRRN